MPVNLLEVVIQFCSFSSGLLCVVPTVAEARVQTNSPVSSFGESLVVLCNEGYVVTGTTSRAANIICGADQTFGVLPVCEGTVGVETMG